MLNPKVLVEISSDGPERYDRGEKFEHYERVPSFEEYVLVSQKQARVEVWTRSNGTWRHRRATSGERLTLESIGCELVVDDLYRGVLDDQ